jgi:uncharacterized protein
LSERTTGGVSPQLVGEVFAVTLLTWAISLLLFKFGRAFSLPEAYVPLLATAPLIYLPLIVILYWHEPLARCGVTRSHTGRALGSTLLMVVITFPLFALGLHVYEQGLFPRRFFHSAFAWFTWLLFTPQAWLWLLKSLLWQFFFVALPEEFFYRGYLQGRLNNVFSTRRRYFGTEVGMALPASAAFFALHHFLTLPEAPRLLVFFPALLFGWLREATGSLLAPGLFHAFCNLFAVLLTKAHPRQVSLFSVVHLSIPLRNHL